MENIESGVSFKTFEHVTSSVDGRQCGNLNMWSVVWKFSVIHVHKIKLMADSMTVLTWPYQGTTVQAQLEKQVYNNRQTGVTASWIPVHTNKLASLIIYYMYGNVHSQHKL